MFLQWVILCGVVVLSYDVIRRLVGDKARIPGPLAGRLSSLYRIWILLDGKGPINYAKLHENYGPVVRTGPKHVSVSDSTLIPVIYDFKNVYLKSAFYNVFRPLYRGLPLDTVFTTQNVAKNKRLKAALVRNMTGCSLNFQPEIQASVDEFVQQMRNSQGDVIDLSYWSFFWSFDLTFDLIFGSSFGYMRQRKDCNRWIHTFKTITSGAAILGQIPELCEWTLASNSFMRFMRRFQSFPDPTQEFIQEIEHQINKHDTVAHDCVRSFMCKILAARGEKFDMAEHTEMVNILFETFFAAAAEIAVTLSTVFYCLLTNKHAYTRLTEELRNDCKHGETRAPFNQDNRYLYVKSLERILKSMTSDEIPSSACIKESLRLYSSNSPPMERVVPPSGLQSSGYMIPPGTIISVPQYLAHRDKDVYGLDADVFRAERWLEADPATLGKMDRNFLAFGRGTRSCVGRDLAMLEIRMLLANVLGSFELEFAKAGELPKITMFWMLDHVGFDVRFKAI